ncbi:MAG: hypothetical protein ACREDX_00865 [Aestuariivirga sp.]
MIHRALIAALAAGLGAGFLAGEAEAGKRRFHIWNGYEGYYLGPRYIPPPRYYRYFEDISPEEYEELYGDDFDDAYYDPNYEPPVRKLKPAKKKAATAPKTKTVTPVKTATQSSAKQPKSESKAALSCDKAGSIIGGYGFSNIKASDCNGQVYAFDAARDGKSYAIKLNALSGELTEVRKVR